MAEKALLQLPMNFPIRVWRRAMHSFGFMNINVMNSTNPEREQAIVENVAGYGRQLGMVVEALSVLVARLRSSTFGQSERWSERDKQYLFGFSRMAREIADEKELGAVMSDEDRCPEKIAEESLNSFVDNLQRLKDSNPVAYVSLRTRLRMLLLDGYHNGEDQG